MTITLHNTDSLQGIADCDAIITDPPYSERTHAGHNAGVTQPKGGVRSNGQVDTFKARHTIDYAYWEEADISAAVAAWAPRCKGWIVVLTDDQLAPVWTAHLARAGRCTFAPLPAVITGASVRLTGDGPSSWTRWIVVARPRHEPYSKWGTLPGAYVGPSERQPWIGGKPLWLMTALVSDYTRRGDTVCDPCLGGGTTAVACKELHRDCIGYDLDPNALTVTRGRLRQGVLPLGGE